MAPERAALRARRRLPTPRPALRQAARERKAHPTRVDALALVRRELGAHEVPGTSAPEGERGHLPRPRVDRLTTTRCYAA